MNDEFTVPLRELPTLGGVQPNYPTEYAALDAAIKDTATLVRGLSANLAEQVRKAQTLSNTCALYDAVRDLDEQLDEAKKSLSKALQFLAVTILPSKFQEEGVSTLTMKELGARFTVNTRVNASMIDKEKAMAWLNEKGHGDIIAPTINSSTLSKFAAEYVLEQGQDLPSDLFKISTIQHMSRTKV